MGKLDCPRDPFYPRCYVCRPHSIEICPLYNGGPGVRKRELNMLNWRGTCLEDLFAEPILKSPACLRDLPRVVKGKLVTDTGRDIDKSKVRNRKTPAEK